METRLTRQGKREFYTTDDPNDFDNKASIFFGEKVASRHANL
jgi:glutamate racemase